MSDLIHIRPATRDDLPPLESFLCPFVAAQQVLERTADELIFLLSTSFVAEQNGRMVGFATLEIYSHKLAEVRSLAVEPSIRGQGVGQGLVEACVELAKRKNVYEVMAITAAEPLFERCGFDAALPSQKKALFLQTGVQPARPLG